MKHFFFYISGSYHFKLIRSQEVARESTQSERSRSRSGMSVTSHRLGSFLHHVQKYCCDKTEAGEKEVTSVKPTEISPTMAPGGVIHSILPLFPSHPNPETQNFLLFGGAQLADSTPSLLTLRAIRLVFLVFSTFAFFSLPECVRVGLQKTLSPPA